MRLIPTLIDDRRTARAQLRNVDNSEEVRKFPRMKEGLRGQKLLAFRDAAKSKIAADKAAAPARAAARAQARELGLANLRAGKPPGTPREKVAPIVDPRPWAAGEPADRIEAIRAQRARDARDELILAELRKNNSLQVLALSSSEQLAGRVAAWRQAAEAGGDFPFEDFGQAQLVGLILQARGSAGDVRAGMAVEQLAGVEGALLRHAGLDGAEDEREDRELEQLEQALDMLGVGGLDHLDAVDAILAPYERALDRQAEASSAGTGAVAGAAGGGGAAA